MDMESNKTNILTKKMRYKYFIIASSSSQVDSLNDFDCASHEMRTNGIT